MNLKIFCFLFFAVLIQQNFALDLDGVTVANIEKHSQNYNNCTQRTSDEYVWIRFKKSDGSLTGYYRVDSLNASIYNSILSIALTSMTSGIPVNIRTSDEAWCGGAGVLRLINLAAG